MLLRRICTVLLAMLFWSFGSGQIGQVEFDDLQKANRLFDQNRFNLALNYYIPIASDPDVGEFVLFRTAYSYMQSRQLDESIAMFGRLLSHSPEHQQGLFYLAYALRMKGEYSKALEYFSRLDELGSPLGKYWSEIALYGIKDEQEPALFSLEQCALRTTNEDIFASSMLNQLLFSQTISIASDPAESGLGPGLQRGSNILFSSPVHLIERRPFHADKSYAYNTGPVSFSSATGLIAYSRNQFYDGVRQVAQAQKGMSIHFAFLDEFTNWVEHHDFPFNDSSYSTGYPFISNDGEVLYFASNMPGGYGGFDIYVSYFIDSAWTEPQNLGPRINTPGDEISPFSDGYYLYFASDWHPGYGGMDIFRADFDYESWETPVNLGKSINSTYDDFGFVFYSRLGKGFLISDRPLSGSGRSDNIWEIKSKTKTVVVKVSDFKKKNTITGALVDLSRCGILTGITDESGEFEFQIAEGFDCYIAINKVGYTSTSFRLRYQDIEGQRKQYKLMLTGTVNFFEGRVVERDGDVTNAVNSVYISAVNEVDGEVQETYSDEGGRVDLHIKPKSRYLLSFAKAGYRPHYININTDLKVNSSVIGQVRLERADNVVIRDVFSKSSKSVKEPSEQLKKKNQDQAKVSSEDFSASNDKSSLKIEDKGRVADRQVVAGTPPTAIRIDDYRPENELAGYVIQVAAITRRNIDITPFKTYLGIYGDLFFTRRDDNLVRIMVGIFKKRSEAQDALYKIRAEDKFKEAFITELPKGIKLEPLENLVTQNRVALPPIESNKKDTSEIVAISPPQKKNEKVEVKPGTTIEYLVQIGKFKNLNWFDNRKVEDIGLIEERREGGFIIVLLSGYLELSEAQEALKKVRELGYNDAFVVKSGSDRKLERVR
jgi:tetratricopeptide (TPR) repeat protein/cell division septation protein DedD